MTRIARYRVKFRHCTVIGRVFDVSHTLVMRNCAAARHISDGSSFSSTSANFCLRKPHLTCQELAVKLTLAIGLRHLTLDNKLLVIDIFSDLCMLSTADTNLRY